MSQLSLNEPLAVRLEEPEGSLDALARAPSGDAADIAARWPACLAAWAALGEAALRSGRSVEAYAYFRVGYHRGLDRLRGSGWRGRGRVPWAHAGNRGFLLSLRGLGLAADEIKEVDEAARCREFLAQLAPDTP
jgi:hypothetical protein